MMGRAMTQLTMCYSHTLATSRLSHQPSPSSASSSLSSVFPTSSPSVSRRRSGLDTTGQCNVRWTTAFTRLFPIPFPYPLCPLVPIQGSEPNRLTPLLPNSTPPPLRLVRHLLLHLLLLALLPAIPQFVLRCVSLSPNPSVGSRPTATRLPTFRLGRRRAQEPSFPHIHIC